MGTVVRPFRHVLVEKDKWVVVDAEGHPICWFHVILNEAGFCVGLARCSWKEMREWIQAVWAYRQGDTSNFLPTGYNFPESL